MGGQKKLRKRIERYFGAAVAAAITTIIAMSALSSADAQTCSLQDATDWQLALNDPSEEQSPDYVRAVTEAFLEACPERPEFYEASRVAGMAAADMGDARSAASHFRNAGPMTNLLANFYAIASFVAAGDEKQAWRTRDQMVERWRTRLERHPGVSISADPVENGMIYQVYFTKPNQESGTKAAWIAVPHGSGWPATLSFSSDRMRLAFRRAKTGQNSPDIRYVDLHRCLGRRTLGQIDTSLSSVDFDTAARASLSAYLAKPDQPRARSNQIDLCVWPARLLPSVPKQAY
ncbi:MAG: hypothetical protein NXH72_02500 [Hyphomonadaceae bacterium]|nr:hypothetical protein [Hyphomonadaceae bacterium]